MENASPNNGGIFCKVLIISQVVKTGTLPTNSLSVK